MRTQKEILERYREREGYDMLGFEVYEYPDWLTFENVKKLNILKEDITKEKWEKDYKKPAKENILERMRNYISFAYGKAEGERGISANRSIMHYIAWIWLLGDDEFLKEIEDDWNNNYNSYGIPILNKICETYRWDRSGNKIK